MVVYKLLILYAIWVDQFNYEIFDNYKLHIMDSTDNLYNLG